MAYVFKQSFVMDPLFTVESVVGTALVSIKDAELSDLYSKHLREVDFFVRKCSDEQNLSAVIAEFKPHVLVCSPKLALDYLPVFHKSHPALRVITVGYNLTEQELANLMRFGITFHCNRKLSKPKDIATLARQLLGS